MAFWLVVLVLVVAWVLSRRIAGLEARITTLEDLARRRAPSPARLEAVPGADAAEHDARHAAARRPEEAAGTTPAHEPRPPAAPPRPEPARRPPIEWERLFGVRGAAVLGGVALALAGLLFFKYSIEHGLIPPWLRVVLGTLVGLVAIVGAELALRRQYAGTANAVTGAGLVILYAACWAAAVRYDLIGLVPAFVLMAGVTATGCALASRHDAQLIAVLGLVGGFATPFVLASGSDRPIGLFTYLLVLDVALLYLAQARRWPALAVASLAATALYETGWIVGRMGPERLPLGIAILAVFGLLYAFAARPSGDAAPLSWRASQTAALLVPVAFTLHLAGDARFGPHLGPYALLVLLLSLAAGWLARTQGAWWLRLGAAAAGVAVMLVWATEWAARGALAWELVAVAVALACTFHAFVEIEPANASVEGPAPAAVVAALGGAIVLVYAMGRAPAPSGPWLVGWTLLSALLVRHALLPGRAVLHVVAAVAAGVALMRLHVVRAVVAGPSLHPGVLLAAAAGFRAIAVRRRRAADAPWTEHAAAAVCVPLLAARLRADASPWVTLGTSLVLGLLVALAALRLGSGWWLLAGMALTALVHGAWAIDAPSAAAPIGLALAAVAVLAFTAWPFLAADRFRPDRLAWVAAALAAPCWFLALRALWTRAFGDGAIGLLPLGLAAVSFAGTLRLRSVFPAGDAARTGMLALFAAVGLGFVSVAVPLQLEKAWVTVGWALEGAAVLWLWTRLPHAGLKGFALVLLAAVTVRLVANPAVLGYYPRSGWRIVNWLLYTYLVPAAALLVAAAILRPRELARLSRWEREHVYVHGQPLGAFATGLAGLVVIFVWLNLAIADWFAAGPMLTVSFARLPARDLTTSIVWALYALALLAIGVGRRSIGLRWVSLALLVLTIAKVFLHDLGELRDLYRVASLAGLAVSLLLVSLAYQRFVFRSAPLEKT